MGTLLLVRRILRLVTRDAVPGSPLAEAVLQWCRCHATLLGLDDLPDAEAVASLPPAPRGWAFWRAPAAGAGAPASSAVAASPWERLITDLARPAPDSVPDRPSPVLALCDRLAGLLGLAEEEARLIEIVVAITRLSLPASLAHRLRPEGLDVVALVGELSGHPSADAIAQSQPVRLGLIELTTGRGGQLDVYLTEALHRVLDRAPTNDDALIECLVGARARPMLDITDFAEQAATADLLTRTLSGALRSGAVGVNVLLYGPPGTGKTELAKVLTEAAGGVLYVVGEVTERGEEPTRWDRVTALKLAQRVLANRRDAVLLFDEMEDLIGEAAAVPGVGIPGRRKGSKVFVNRMFETNPVPTLWTSNDIANVDPAFLRRMNFVLRMDLPVPSARRRIFRRIAREEDLRLSDEALLRLAETAPEATTVARNAVRTACLADGGEDDAERAVASLVAGIRHGRLRPPVRTGGPALDLDLYEADVSIAALIDKLAADGAPLDFSLLLTGPPGTGKTALAHHIARRLDRPLVVKRASDLLSKWIGETEQQIARAFAEAAHYGTVLLFDELDSLLFDRGTAQRSWEVSQVNELLTWMDHHPLPFIAATNHAAKLDPAALRRFVFKIALESLSPDRAARAFATYFGGEAPADLARVAGLTPGDFAVVARQIRFDGSRPGPDAIVDLLAREAEAKPAIRRRIGF